MTLTVSYMILICMMLSKVISFPEDNPENLPLDSQPKVQHNKEDIRKRFEDLAAEENLQISPIFHEPLESSKRDKETKIFQNLFSHDSNGLQRLSKTLDHHSSIDAVFFQYFQVSFPDDYNAHVEDEDLYEKEISKNNMKKKRDQRNMKISSEVELLNSSDTFLINRENKTSVNEQETSLNQRNPQSDNQKRHSRALDYEADSSFQESLLNITEQVARHGYKARGYTVQTDDGYILGLHRIEKSQREHAGKGVPVLLMHGLLLSSACWLGAGPGTGLAYLLAQDGYDVWLGNARGNYYSRAHASIDPNSSAFWQFSADEHGKYDLPAMIDKVLNETGAQKLNYVGFSQGGGTYFIMCSELPHYCDKAKVMVALAPSGRHLLTKSSLFRLFCEFAEKNEKELLQNGIYEMLPKNVHVQKILNFFCRKSALTLRLCELFKDLLDSHHPGSFTKESILNMVATFPSGTSVHNLARFGQCLRSRSIYKFDYGPEKNFQLYGSSKPPKYNLSSVTVPVVLIYGRNDGIVDIGDVKWLIQKLPNVIEDFEVNDPLWTHMDVTYSQYVPRLLYPKIKEYLN